MTYESLYVTPRPRPTTCRRRCARCGARSASGYRAEPRLLALSLGLALLMMLPDALLALWLKFLVDGVLDDDQRRVIIAGIGLAVSVTATWYLSLLSQRVQRRFRDRIAIALESHVAHLQASVPTIEHHERPEYLDRLAMLRDQVFALDHMFMSLFSTLGWLFRLAITAILLASIHPVLVLLMVFALPAFWVSTWRPAVERQVRGVGDRQHPPGPTPVRARHHGSRPPRRCVSPTPATG